MGNSTGKTSPLSRLLEICWVNGDAKELRYLFETQPQLVDLVNHVEPTNGMSLLICAAIKGFLEILQTLLEYDANTHIKDHYQRTAIVRAAENGHLNCFQLLLNFRNKPSSEDVNDALDAAAQYGHVDICKSIVRSGRLWPSVPSKNRALFHASLNGQTQVVKYLLSKGSDPLYALNPVSGSAIMAAAMHGHVETIKCLVDAGANITQVNAQGHTLLQRTMEGYRIDPGIRSFGLLIEYLIENGQELERVDEYLYDGVIALTGVWESPSVSDALELAKNTGGGEGFVNGDGDNDEEVGILDDDDADADVRRKRKQTYTRRDLLGHGRLGLRRLTVIEANKLRQSIHNGLCVRKERLAFHI